jgi:hypothetical protein
MFFLFLHIKISGGGRRFMFNPLPFKLSDYIENPIVYSIGFFVDFIKNFYYIISMNNEIETKSIDEVYLQLSFWEVVNIFNAYGVKHWNEELTEASHSPLEQFVRTHIFNQLTEEQQERLKKQYPSRKERDDERNKQIGSG